VFDFAGVAVYPSRYQPGNKETSFSDNIAWMLSSQDVLAGLYPGAGGNPFERVYLKAHGGKLAAQAASMHTIAAFLTLFVTQLGYSPKGIADDDYMNRAAIGCGPYTAATWGSPHPLMWAWFVPWKRSAPAMSLSCPRPGRC
jgi:hypothetical protein